MSRLFWLLKPIGAFSREDLFSKISVEVSELDGPTRNPCACSLSQQALPAISHEERNV